MSAQLIEVNMTETSCSTTQRLAYGITDATEAVSIGRSTLYKEISAGRLKTFKIGNRTLIAADSLNEWLSSYQSDHASELAR